MAMKQLLYRLAVLCTLLLLTACQGQSDVEETTLELSTQAVSLGKDASSQQVTIMTNQPGWSYIVAQTVDWLSIGRTGDVLTISVTDNPSEEIRRAVVLVRADDALARLTIEQAGATPEFSLETTTRLTFTSLSGEKTINLGGLGKRALVDKLDEEATWLTVRQLSSSVYALRVDAQPEVGSRERMTKVIITVGDRAYEVEVVQEPQRYYMLPLIMPQLNVRGMIEHEEARGSQLIRHPGGDNLRYYHFAASAHMGSPGYIEYDYAFVEEEVYSKASVLYKGTERFVETDGTLHPDFVRFMQSEGFEAIERTDVSEDLSMRIPRDAYAFFARTVGALRFVAYVTRINNQKDTRVELRHEKAKDPSAPIEDGRTFPRLPLSEQLLWIGSQAYGKDATRKKDDIHAWELAKGSTYSEKASQQRPGFFYSFYEVKPTEQDPEMGRGYTTLTPGRYWVPGVNLTLGADHRAIGDVEGALAAYSDVSYMYRYEDGVRVIIPAARKLFADAGFPWERRQQDGADVFRNKTTNQAYIVDTYLGDDGKTLLRVRLTYVGF